MDQFDTALRLLAATATGMVLGLNRDLEGKPLGARTLGLVGMSSALVALAVTQIPEIAQYPDALSRAIQGIVVGVLTGIGGGMVRDLLVQEIPIVLRREIYAVAGLAGALKHGTTQPSHSPRYPKHNQTSTD